MSDIPAWNPGFAIQSSTDKTWFSHLKRGQDVAATLMWGPERGMCRASRPVSGPQGLPGRPAATHRCPPRCLPRHEVSIGTACCVFAASGPRSQCLGVTLQIRSGGRWPSRGDAPHIATYQQTLFPAQTLPSKWARAVRSILVLDFEWDHCIFLLDYSYSTEGFFIFAS